MLCVFTTFSSQILYKNILGGRALDGVMVSADGWVKSRSEVKI